jgi:hypothetical protein
MFKSPRSKKMKLNENHALLFLCVCTAFQKRKLRKYSFRMIDEIRLQKVSQTEGRRITRLASYSSSIDATTIDQGIPEKISGKNLSRKHDLHPGATIALLIWEHSGKSNVRMK